jgi:hypothetical protein
MAASGNAAPTTTAELASAIEQARWLLDATFERQRTGEPGPRPAWRTRSARPMRRLPTRDAVVHGLMQGLSPLWATTHADSTGGSTDPCRCQAWSRGPVGGWFRDPRVAGEAPRNHSCSLRYDRGVHRRGGRRRRLARIDLP